MKKARLRRFLERFLEKRVTPQHLVEKGILDAADAPPCSARGEPVPGDAQGSAYFPFFGTPLDQVTKHDTIVDVPKLVVDICEWLQENFVLGKKSALTKRICTRKENFSLTKKILYWQRQF